MKDGEAATVSAKALRHRCRKCQEQQEDQEQRGSEMRSRCWRQGPKSGWHVDARSPSEG